VATILAHVEIATPAAATRGRLRPLRIRLSDPSLADDLLEFLRSKECVAEHTGAETFYVEPPSLPVARAGLLELDLYLRVWDSLHPETIAWG
jgi:hypothetical protein